MRRAEIDHTLTARGVTSLHSGILLFMYAVILALFMAGVIFINGS